MAEISEPAVVPMTGRQIVEGGYRALVGGWDSGSNATVTDGEQAQVLKAMLSRSVNARMLVLISSTRSPLLMLRESHPGFAPRLPVA